MDIEAEIIRAASRIVAGRDITVDRAVELAKDVVAATHGCPCEQVTFYNYGDSDSDEPRGHKAKKNPEPNFECSTCDWPAKYHDAGEGA